MKKFVLFFLSLTLLLAVQPVNAAEPTIPATGAYCYKDSQCGSGKCVPNAEAEKVGAMGVCSQGRIMLIDDMSPGPEVLPGRIYLPEDGNIITIACNGEIATNLTDTQTKIMCFDDVIAGPRVGRGCVYLLSEGIQVPTFSCETH